MSALASSWRASQLQAALMLNQRGSRPILSMARITRFSMSGVMVAGYERRRVEVAIVAARELLHGGRA